MLILGIETSCDETSVALVEDGRIIRANDIVSQARLHACFGGVVPEVASRAHIRRLIPMIDACLTNTGLTLDDVDALAVTLGPGLIGALLVGVETAKALAFSRQKPLIPVHHIAGHLYAPFLSSAEHGQPRTKNEAAPLPRYPYIGLAVSGGHTSLVFVSSPVSFHLLGETVDDAAGETMDKIARLLELGYPGGPLIDNMALGPPPGNPCAFKLPRPMIACGNLNFSFSGLKTAVIKLARDIGLQRLRGDEQMMRDLCASFQEAVVDVLLTKAEAALESTGAHTLAIVGGVACNSRLRALAPRRLKGAIINFPPPELCTDNAAMIAGLAWHLRHLHPACDLALNARADLPLNTETRTTTDNHGQPCVWWSGGGSNP
ncbi:MAG: tRNA (adenosine(37)-N6)-threonylcarbamoyltransferase complex transferase subunit TsaD [Candidatus Sumerlaeota bacterium]|nr:tRNA (adenosine(37)-N6)-threonylcarbamoyltransferase complex transferase subunit TsaD [Candidatus Sumerlaeota bacterium]